MISKLSIGRRKMLKNLVLGSGLVLYPSLFHTNKKEQLIHLVVIGTPCTSYVEEFIISNPNISCISIGGDIGNAIIDYDFSFIKMQFEKFNYAYAKIPDTIKSLFSTPNKYIIISELNKPNVLLSKLVVEYLQNNSIDFRFLGTTPFFNPALGRWGKDFFNELLNDTRLTIFDVNEYLLQLRQINSDILAVDAIELLDDELTDILIGMISI